MELAVVGATGRTGQQVVEQALQRGHRVTALARRPEALRMRHAQLRTCAADVLEPDGLVEMLAGADAVVSTLGVGTSRATTTLYSEGVTNLLDAMRRNETRRLIVVSATPVGPREDQPFLERRLVIPVLDQFFGASYRDMHEMEALLLDSDRAWTALRPPRLLDKPATGTYRLDANHPLPKARSVTIGDLASALMDSISRTDLHRRAVYVAN